MTSCGCTDKSAVESCVHGCRIIVKAGYIGARLILANWSEGLEGVNARSLSA